MARCGESASAVAMNERLGSFLPASDRAAWIAAHQAVFGVGAVDIGSMPQWVDWKYRHGRGVALWSGDEVAAFCGGLERTVWWEGRAVRALQVVDVMVRPKWRHGAGRRSAFYRVSKQLYDEALAGSDAALLTASPPRCAFGFGFPSHRHLRLAERLNLLRDAGPMHAGAWRTGATRGTRAAGSTSTPPAVVRQVSSAIGLWWSAYFGRTLRKQLPSAWVGDRSWQWMQWRHGQPGLRSVWLTLHRPGRWWPQGVAIVRPPDAQGQVLWLDWLGDPQQLSWAARGLLDWCSEHGAEGLHGWFSALPWKGLADFPPDGQAEAARIGMPIQGSYSAAALEQPRWWLMAGDSDFL